MAAFFMFMFRRRFWKLIIGLGRSHKYHHFRYNINILTLYLLFVHSFISSDGSGSKHSFAIELSESKVSSFLIGPALIQQAFRFAFSCKMR
jgi:hypothetical protein